MMLLENNQTKDCLVHSFPPLHLSFLINPECFMLSDKNNKKTKKSNV